VIDNQLIEAINQYGFPIIAAIGLGYFVFYVWRWVTTDIQPVLGQANTTLIALIDRVRMLDNDMIRLNTKLTMVLEMKAHYEKVTGEEFPVDLSDVDDITAKYSTKSETWKQPGDNDA